MNSRVFRRSPVENAPSSPGTPITPAGGLPGYGRLPPPPAPGTLPHPLENATRFPQPTGPRDGEGRREEDCTVLIVATAQE